MLSWRHLAASFGDVPLFLTKAPELIAACRELGKSKKRMSMLRLPALPFKGDCPA